MTPSFLGAALVHRLRIKSTSERRWLDLARAMSRPSPAAMHSFSGFVLPRIALHRGDEDVTLPSPPDHDAADGGLFHTYAEAIRVEGGHDVRCH